MKCGDCANTSKAARGFPDSVFCRRYLLHMDNHEDASRCRSFEAKVKTHGDQIRAMTDADLAAFIAKMFYDEDAGCPINRFEDMRIRCHVYDNECEACWLDWLAQPPEEGEL